MTRSGAVTFKGNPVSLRGEELKVGQPAPDFTLHFAGEGIQELKLSDLKGKPTLISVVPSLDTGVCQTQTKRFNEELGALAGKVNAVTVSRDLPFAQARFCGAEGIKEIRTASDYQTHQFGEDYGLTIDELKLLSRAVIVLDADGKVVYTETVKEVASEPDYGAALEALRKLL
jgi:thioredoxin-dependent peroxiredoxin